MTILVFPAYDDNPYLSILHAAARADGQTVRNAIALPDFLDAVAELAPGDVIHMNWTAQVTQSARTPWGAERNVRRVLRALDAAQERGVRLVWTIHNAMAHDARNAKQDARLSTELASRADGIHVMNRATEHLVDFPLPAERVKVIPHPSYLGEYADAPVPIEARERLGVPEGDLAVLMLGHMKPYKGVLDLVAAAERATRPLTMMLAGQGTPKDWRAIDAALTSELRTVVQRDYVAEENVPLWFAAADVMVLPYRRILNSGSAMLSATFGVPVVMPDEESVVREYGDCDWVITYDRNEPVAGIQRVLNDTSIDWAAKGLAAREFAGTVRPEQISRQFGDLLRDL